MSNSGKTLSNAYLPKKDELAYPNRPTRTVPDSLRSWRPTSYGLVANVKAATWRSNQSGVGMDVVWDHQRGRYAIIYGADDATTSQFGINFADNLDKWDNADLYPNPIFGPNPVGGQADSGGVTFPQIVWDNGLWYMFYIAFPLTGFEQGTSKICVATCPTLSTTSTDWVRQGVMLDPVNVPWINTMWGTQGVLYRPNVVKNDDGTWGMFFNGGKYGVETIGYATSTTLLGPWTAIPTTVLTATQNPNGDNFVSDPEVLRIDDMWYMFVWCNAAGGSMALAYTTPSLYPLGWQFYPQTVGTGIRGTYVNAPDGARLFTFSGNGPRISKPTKDVAASSTLSVLSTTPGLGVVGAWNTQIDSTVPLGIKVYSDGVQNSSISYDEYLAYGNYKFDLIVNRGANCGIFTIQIDGVTVGTIDSYAAGSTPNLSELASVFVPSDGLHRITLLMATKNASSTGYFGVWSAFTMTKIS